MIMVLTSTFDRYVQFNWIDDAAFVAHSVDGAFDFRCLPGQFDIHPTGRFAHIGAADVRHDLDTHGRSDK